MLKGWGTENWQHGALDVDECFGVCHLNCRSSDTSIYALRMTCTERMPRGTRGTVLSLQGKSLSWCARCSQISFKKHYRKFDRRTNVTVILTTPSQGHQAVLVSDIK
jgi:hypothetical protein